MREICNKPFTGDGVWSPVYGVPGVVVRMGKKTLLKGLYLKTSTPVSWVMLELVLTYTFW